MKTILPIVLLAVSAAAQQHAGAVGGTVSRGNFLPIPRYSTPGDGTIYNLYVDPTGSDGNPCTTSGTGACATIQGALQKAPKELRDRLQINVAAGTYPGFYVAGFKEDPTFQRANGGINFVGVRATSTLATGSATGTATSGTNGTASTMTGGTLTDNTQTWTVNDLRGRYLRITGGTGSGQIVPIVSNTSTVITVARTSWTAPSGTSTYIIEDSGVIINTCVGTLPSPSQTTESSTAGAGIFISGNLGMRMQFADFKVSGGACQNGVEVSSSGSVVLQRVQVASGFTSASFKMSDFANAATMNVLDCTSTSTTVTSHISTFDNQVKSQISFSGFVGSGTTTVGLDLGTITVSAMTNVWLSGVSVGFDAYQYAMIDAANINITCTNASGIAAGFGAVFQTTSPPLLGYNYGATTAVVTALAVTTCGTGIWAYGAGVGIDIGTLSGAAGTTGIAINNGARVNYSRASMSLTAGTNEINLESGATTAAFTDLSTGTCLGSAMGSYACAK